MVGSTFLCVPFIQVRQEAPIKWHARWKSETAAVDLHLGRGQMLNRGWIRYYWLGAIIQHVLQTAFLALAVRWTFHRSARSNLDLAGCGC